MNSFSSYGSPLVSVIMSVYNTQNFLNESIDSILSQSFKDFEFIIINDGSNDNISAIVKEYLDPRIRFFDFKQNEGLIKRLNYGFLVAKGKYIAIMDSDDISTPNRLKIEVDFLDNNPDYGMCSAFCEIVDQYGNRLNKYYKSETTNDQIKIQLLFHNKIPHDTVMIRREIIEKFSLKYDENYGHVEDYKMWYEISKVTKIAAIPEVLLKYRAHPEQVSSLHTETQKERSLRVVIEQLNGLGISPSDKELEIHTILSKSYLLKTFEPDYLTEVDSWLQKIKEGNLKNKVYDSLILDDYLSERYKEVTTNWEYLKPNKFCNICHSNFKDFYFAPPEFIQQWDANEYLHSIFALETFNLLGYECPDCGSNDIDRLTFLYLEEKLNDLAPKAVLNLSSSPIIHNYFKAKARILSQEYQEKDWFSILSGADVEGFDKEKKDFADVLLCVDVLQKVEDDIQALKRLYSFMKPGGYGVIMAPIQLTLNQNYEPEGITEDTERWKHFGHSSNKRLYAKEGFISRLQNAGFEVECLGLAHFTSLTFEKYGIHPRSVLYIVKKNINN